VTSTKESGSGIHALYPISGNPPTLGHADILRRAARVFGHVTWALAVNPDKIYRVSLEVRQEMMTDYIRHLDLKNVSVEQYEGATVRFAEKIGATVIVKGLRDAHDLRAEMEQSFGNRGINPGVETMLMMADPGLSRISSSLIRELALLGEDIDEYVLPGVAERLRRALATK